MSSLCVVPSLSVTSLGMVRSSFDALVDGIVQVRFGVHGCTCSLWRGHEGLAHLFVYAPLNNPSMTSSLLQQLVRTPLLCFIGIHNLSTLQNYSICMCLVTLAVPDEAQVTLHRIQTRPSFSEITIRLF